MSYSCPIYLVSNVDKDDVYWMIREEVERYKRNMVGIIQRYVDSCFDWELDFDSDIVKNKKRVKAAMESMKQYFTFRVYYWEEYKLLGFMTEKGFNKGTFVVFQNSVDQDYDLKTWESIPCLHPILQEYKGLTVEEVKKWSFELYGWTVDETSDVEYYRKTLMYQEVFRFLDIKDLIFNPSQFLKKHMSLAIHTLENHEDLHRFRISLEKVLKEREDKKSKL